MDPAETPVVDDARSRQSERTDRLKRRLNFRGPAGRGEATRSPSRSDAVSVSQLVDKVGRREDRSPRDREDDTDTIPRVVDTPMPDLSEKPPHVPSHARATEDEASEPAIERAARLADLPPPPALPEEVGVKPPLTRLAMSRLRRRRRMRIVGRSVVAIVAILAVMMTGMAWGYLRSTDKHFIQVSALDQDSTDVVDPVGQTGDETFLIVGTDSRAGANSEVGAGTADEFEGSARSDTVMLVNIPANRERVVAVSFPRDLDVDRPQCRGWNNDKGEYTDEIFDAAPNDKLNATYALGGPKCLVKVIQKMSGLRIGHFVGMDFSGFEAMVNQVGGVEVCTTEPLVDYELGEILTQTGKQKIDGATALNYVRARNIETEGNGDYGRIKRQQRFLSSLLRSALSNNVLLDPGKLNGFIEAFTRETFVQNVTTRDLLTLGRSLQGVDAGAVTFLTVPTDGTNEWGNEIPRKSDIKAIFNAIISDDPLPGEERSTSSTTSASPTGTNGSTATVEPSVAVDPSSISLQISNASGESGLAATTATSLADYGFDVANVGNYESGTSSNTIVRFSEGQQAEAQTVASAIPNAVIEQVQGLGTTIELVIGTNFSGLVKTPTRVGTALAPAQITRANTELPADLAVTNAGDESCS
ncbi:LCP family protein [Antrihabitans sp. YC2-6]|nr:LCP family protein [Antrihabitans sp. YC2-6]